MVLTSPLTEMCMKWLQRGLIFVLSGPTQSAYTSSSLQACVSVVVSISLCFSWWNWILLPPPSTRLPPELWKHEETHQSTDWYSIRPTSEELEPRTKAGFQDTLQTSARSPHVLTVSVVCKSSEWVFPSRVNYIICGGILSWPCFLKTILIGRCFPSNSFILALPCYLWQIVMNIYP